MVSEPSDPAYKGFAYLAIISAWVNLLHYLRIFDDHLGTKFDDIETLITIIDILKQRWPYYFLFDKLTNKRSFTKRNVRKKNSV